MLTQDDVIEIVRNYAEEIEQCGVHLRTVILYGSFAKGKQHEWSDIDVALVADDFTGFGFLDIKKFACVNIRKPYIRIEAKTYPTEYFRSGDPFINEIKKDGIIILDRMTNRNISK
jgi:predicted nucleotidyltransferase